MRPKNTLRIGTQSIAMVNGYVEFNMKKIIGAEKNSDKDGKVLHKLMTNTVNDKTKRLKKWNYCKTKLYVTKYSWQ